MSTPRDHLPELFHESVVYTALESISSPRPTSVRSLTTSGSFHVIYKITYQPQELAAWLSTRSVECRSGTTELILRISGNHIDKIKTENEAAILFWLRTHTKIPVPQVIAFDSSRNNSFQHEYILLTREPGECLADVFQQLSSVQMDLILEQLIDLLASLHAHSWQHIGGLRISTDGDIVPGPVVEETFWHIPDIAQYWPPSESFETLNISGPYANYVDYTSAHISRYIHAIEIHPSLLSMRDLVPRLRAFLALILKPEFSSKLNDVALRLAHKDLHFGNILVDLTSPDVRITSILDWEFSGVVPYTRWNPARAFLWNAQDTATSLTEKQALIGRFNTMALEKGKGFLIEDAKFKSAEQERMHSIWNYLRALVESCPRGLHGDLAPDWRSKVEEALADFGV